MLMVNGSEAARLVVAAYWEYVGTMTDSAARPTATSSAAWVLAVLRVSKCRRLRFQPTTVSACVVLAGNREAVV